MVSINQVSKLQNFDAGFFFGLEFCSFMLLGY